jgi:hypothetical protein
MGGSADGGPCSCEDGCEPGLLDIVEYLVVARFIFARYPVVDRDISRKRALADPISLNHCGGLDPRFPGAVAPIPR